MSTWGLTSSRDILEDVAQAQKGPENFFIGLGLCGLGAGQLEEELARNVWLTVPADAHVLFETLPTEKYQQAVRLLGISETMLSDVAGHESCLMNAPCVRTVIVIDYDSNALALRWAIRSLSTPSLWKIIQNKDKTSSIQRIRQIARDWSAHEFALGIPRHPDTCCMK